ncbi:hypothetical protein HNV11_10700 [Spirosoma taeanense]|uniref:AlgX/AlgJ SGNH hydrolase-like domain-containing protein n=1 Tax=Spirosoma taeanense TaxID=2735870 RepID=A0A6M5YAE7_9BACT|nr:hypothetical protein [Spirosoma taeanense]QJW89812.1 hypothetical protein HNV11_10700 [Spirosoma taeanense]
MRFLRYTVLFAALVLWAGGLSSTVAHWLYEAGIIVDDYRYGDLYRISALPQFKDHQPNCQRANRSSDTASTHLYIIGDSFSEEQRINKDDFRVSHFQRVKWDFVQRAQLDPGKRNVLLLESVERHFRDHFSRPVNELVVQADTSRTPAPTLSWRRRLGDDLHRSDMEERLESALFSHDWAFWFKELKARFTLNWFDRTSTGVSLSRNHQHIFLHSDTDTTADLSSYASLTDREVSNLVDSVNVVADRYIKLGFDEVYLSIIPNKASILEPNRGPYNHLIERVQSHPALRVKPVNVYSPFKQSAQSPYLVGDTHWNCLGRSLWLQQIYRTISL